MKKFVKAAAIRAVRTMAECALAYSGFDLKKAHEMAKQRGTEDFSESLKKTCGSNRNEQEGEDVHILPA